MNLSKIPKILSGIFFVLFWFLLVVPKKAFALSSLKDVISTSRPSAAAALAVGASSPANQLTIIDNLSRFIASDSALLAGGTAENVTVASMSAANVPSAGQRKVTLTSATAQNHGIGTSMYVPVTAKHTVSFRNTTAIPSGGKIQVVFPAGNTTNPGLPAPFGFSFNNLTSSTGPTAPNVSVTGASCGSYTVTPSTGIFQCNLNTGVTNSTLITINIGSTTPILINPSKTDVGGTADIWTITVKTLDDSSVELESTKTKIGTVESVEVYATVEPTFTFSIAGLTNNQAVNTGNTGNFALGCSNSELINTGFNSTSIEVNLGTLSSSIINISAQLLTVATNASNGYTITATSSGHLIDTSTGYWLTDAQGDSSRTAVDDPVPAVLTAGTTTFGVHACGSAVPVQWGTGQTGSGTGAKYANPNATYYYTIASDTSGAVLGTNGDGTTTVEYAATVSNAVPAGLYRTVMTYVATPIF